MRTVALHDWDNGISDTVNAMNLTPFDRVILCVEERHIQYRQKNVEHAIELLHDKGFTVYLDPWGVGNAFAGEATGTYDGWEPWIEFANRSEANGIMLDEPKNPRRIGAYVTQCDKPVLLALQPESLAYASDKVELSVSTYNFGPNDWYQWESRLESWHSDLPKRASVWVQTFRVPEEYSDVPGQMVKFWEENGRDVNIWSWNASRTISSIAPDLPDRVWSGIMDAMK